MGLVACEQQHILFRLHIEKLVPILGFPQKEIQGSPHTAGLRSDAPILSRSVVVDQEGGAAGGEVWQIAGCRLAFRGCQGCLDVGHRIEIEDCDQVGSGGSGQGLHRAFVDCVLAQAGNFFG